MMICDNCGELCDEDDLPTYTEDYGYDTGVGYRSCPQTFTDCDCSCGGTFVDAKRCEICDEWCNPDDLHGGVCDSCLDDSVDVDYALLIGDENKEKIEINGFLSQIFSETEIENLLKNRLNENKSFYRKETENYCLDDKDYFGEMLTNEQKQSNNK